MVFKDRAALFLATAGPIGHAPFAPGTFGSLLGLAAGYGLSLLPNGVALILTVCLLLLSVWAAGTAEKILRQKDPGSIVIDEVAGMAVTMLGLSVSFKTALIAFVLFRIFDIAKPFPIRRIEHILPGGFGVVMDDVVAGLMGNIILRLLYWLAPAWAG